MLAAVTALTLGVGSAMAQSEVPAGAGNYNGGRQAVPAIVTDWSNQGQAQSGSSDIDAPRNSHVLPFNGDFGDLANPG